MTDEQVVEVAGSEAPRPFKKRKPKMIAVKIIKSKGESALVEWVEGESLKRGYVPLVVVQEEAVSDEDLGAAGPYGLPWEALVPHEDAREIIALDLRRHGIWTERELLAGDPRAAFYRYAERLYGEFIKKVKGV